MEIPAELIAKARPFFLNYFNHLAKDMNTLTAAPVSCSLGNIRAIFGEDQIFPLFETDRSVAYSREDGTDSGDVHIVMDVATAISLTGMMMMMGESIIQEQVKNREYTEETQEGFQEVANQVVGALNDLIERKIDGGHLYLEHSKYYEIGELPETFDTEGEEIYLEASVDIQIGNFPPSSSSWLFSRKTAELMLGFKLPNQDGSMPEPDAKEDKKKQKMPKGGTDLSAFADQGFDVDDSKPDLSDYAGSGEGEDGGIGDEDIDLSKYGGGDEDGEEDIDLSKYAGEDEAAEDIDLSKYGGEDEEKKKKEDIDLSKYAGEEEKEEDVDLSSYADAGEDHEEPEKPDLEKYATRKKPSGSVRVDDGMANPDEPGSVKEVMTDPPFSLGDKEKVIRAINAMRQEGHKVIGVDDKDGKLAKVISRSDLRQLMGPFFGTKAMNARDKAICTVPLEKVNRDQSLVRITLEGSINQAANLLMEFELSALPVISTKGVLRGFIPASSLIDFYRKKYKRNVDPD